MSRLWWATIAGLVLGAAFFGMLQRGCQAEGRPGDGSAITERDDNARAARDGRASGSRARRPQILSPEILNPRAQPDMVTLSRGGTAATNPVRPRMPSDRNRGRDRAAAQERSRESITDLSDRVRRDAIERRRRELEEQRRDEMLARERFLREQQRVASQSRSGSTVQMGAGERSDRVAGAAMEQARGNVGNAMRGDLATQQFQAGISDGGGSGSGGRDSSTPRAETASQGSGEASGGQLGASGGPIALESVGSAGNAASGGSGGGGDGSGGGDGTGDGGLDGGSGGSDSPGDGDSGSGDAGDGDPSGDAGSPGGGGSPDDGGGNPDGGGPIVDPGPQPILQPVTAVWQSAPVSGCPETSGVRTADLFLGFQDPSLALVMSSQGPLSLRVDGGRFFQDTSPFGSNVAPSQALQEAFPCIRSDSFLAIGDEPISFVPGGAPDPADWGQSLQATWFSQSGAVATPDPVRFGDGRFYLRVARISVAGTGNVSVSGAMTVNFVNLLNGNAAAAVVDIPNCESCWAGVDSPIVEAELESFELTSRRVTGGGSATGLVRLAAPAPIGGATIEITGDRPAIATAPAFVTVPAGEREAAFEIQTARVAESRRVVFFATLGETTLRQELDVTVIGVGRLAFNPRSVLGGRTVNATIGLTASAGREGERVKLLISPAGVIDAPASVMVEPGRTEATFDITTLPVIQTTSVQILAFIADVGVFAELEIRALSGDLNGDGRVGSADLALLLGSWGPCPSAGACAGDLNGDGSIGSDDLALLLGAWGDSVFDDDGPDGGNDPDDPDAGLVVARWIEVDVAACDELASSFRSADLYLGFEEAPGAPVVSSDLVRGLDIVVGAFYQDPFGTNAPPGAGAGSILPCLPLDSHLTIGGATPLFVPGREPNAENWGGTLIAEWTAIPSPQIQIVTDPGLFGSDREFLRIGRFTAEDTAVVSGQLGVVFVNPASGALEEVTVEVPDWRLAVERLDLNLDGVVDAQDVSALVGMMERGESGGDLTGDGVVNGEDLRVLMDVVSTGPQVEAR